MAFMPTLFSFLRNIFRQKQVDQQLDEEIGGYVEMLMDEKVGAGVSAEEARRQALLEVEGTAQVKEDVRMVRSGALLLSVLQDLRYGARLLRKRLSLTILAVLTLALGLGVNTAIFSVVNAVLLEPLPYPQPDRLMMVWSVFSSAGLSRAPASGPELEELRIRSRLFQDFGGIWAGSGALTGEGEPEQIKLGLVTANFFSVLGVKPALGRTFLPEEEGGRGASTILLSDGLWRRRYGADPRILGRAIRTASGTRTVVGVMPHSFELIFPVDANVPVDIQAWIPFPYPIAQGPRDLNSIRVIGRLRPEATLPQAQAELESIARQLRAQFREYSEQALNLQAIPLQGDTVKEVRPALLALFAGVSLVLLIACANVANLLLTRASERVREMTMRSALGATRARIVRQLLTEGVLLAFLGGAVGMIVAEVLLKALSIWPAAVPRINSAELNLPVLIFTSALCVITGLGCGLAPALGVSKVNLIDALKDTGKGGGAARQKFRRLLVSSEMILAFVLLMGAGLMVRTFVQLLHVDPGFSSRQVLTFAISLPDGRYPDDVKRVEFLRRLETDLSALPGVQAAGSVSHLPLDDFPNWYSYYWPEGAGKEQQTTWMADHRSVSASFFAVLGIPLVSGRVFNESDDVKHPRVVIVDESLAQQTWPGQNPVGKKLNVEVIVNGDFVRGWAEVVGTVKPVKYHSLMRQVRGQLYLPYMQCPRPQLQMSFVVRAQGPIASLVDAIRHTVANLDKDLPISKARPLEYYVGQARARTRFTTFLASLLGFIALLLACIGVYGVTAHSVAQSTSEIGVRMALGAKRSDIIRTVLGRGLGIVAPGIVAGALCSLGLAPLLSSLLFQVKPVDWPTVAAVGAVLTSLGCLACYLPARKASHMDPMAVLRTD
jgi:predicted permease